MDSSSFLQISDATDTFLGLTLVLPRYTKFSARSSLGLCSLVQKYYFMLNCYQFSDSAKEMGTGVFE